METTDKLSMYLSVLDEDMDINKIMKTLKKIDGVDFVFEKDNDLFVEIKEPKNMKDIISKIKSKFSFKKVEKKEDDLIRIRR